MKKEISGSVAQMKNSLLLAKVDQDKELANIKSSRIDELTGVKTLRKNKKINNSRLILIPC